MVIFIDGIAQDDVSNYGTDITNIERVEVLRGSQGTLYGKNAIGGVINIISKKPDIKAQAGTYIFMEKTFLMRNTSVPGASRVLELKQIPVSRKPSVFLLRYGFNKTI